MAGEDTMKFILWYLESSGVDSFEKKCNSLLDLFNELVVILKGNFKEIKITKVIKKE